MRRTLLTAGFFIFIAAGPLAAGNASSSAGFLDENLGARQVGMGGVSAAILDGSASMLSNPAALSVMTRPEINLSYASTQDQSRHAWTGYAHPVRRPHFSAAFGVGFSYYSAGNIDVNYADGTTKSFNAEKSYVGAVTLSTRFRKFLALGVTPKFLQSTLIEQFTAKAYAADLGVLVFPFPVLLRERLVLGGSVRNAGSQITYRTAAQDLPRTDALGLSLRLWQNAEYGSFLASAQGEKTTGEITRYRMGGEFVYGSDVEERAFFIRGGYQMHFENEDFSVGVGMREKNFVLDYAFVNSQALEKTHRFTLLFRFGRYVRPKDRLRYELMEEEKDLEKPEPVKLIKPEKSDSEYFLLKDENKKEEFKLTPETPKKR